MNLTRTLFRLLVFPALSLTGWGEGTAHFRRVDIPRNESRLSELAGVREFRCDYDLGRKTQGTLLIAERYKDGVCIGRFRLSRAKYDGSKDNRTGILSIGWQHDAERLVSVHDNGDLYNPWCARATFPGFRPQDAHYFMESKPEKRKPEDEGSDHSGYELYPVIAISGERSLQIRYSDVHDSGSFLTACGQAGAREAVIIYLYFSPYDGEPAAGFTQQ